VKYTTISAKSQYFFSNLWCRNKIFAIVYLSPLQATEYYGDLQAHKGAAAKMVYRYEASLGELNP